MQKILSVCLEMLEVVIASSILLVGAGLVGLDREDLIVCMLLFISFRINSFAEDLKVTKQ